MTTIMEWFETFWPKTKALVRAADFEALKARLPESSTSGELVQALAKSCWDTTHTFHITGRKMTMTPYDFHRLTKLRAKGPPINLESMSGTTLDKELLGIPVRPFDTTRFLVTSSPALRRLMRIGPRWPKHSCFMWWGSFSSPTLARPSLCRA